jgi:hypothetical protein
MKKVLIIATLCSLSMSVQSFASTITVSDFSGVGATFAENVVTLGDGTKLASGSGSVRLGFFPTMTPSEVGTLFRSFTTPQQVANGIQTNFVPLGEGLDPDLGAPGGTGGASPPRFATRAINGVAGVTGRLAGSVINVTPVPGAWNPANITGVPAGTRLYMLIYDAAVALNSNQFGIFSADTWLMPSDTLVNPTLNTVDVGASEVFLGSSAAGSLRLSVVPEPSASLMAVLASLGLVARRRR